MSGSWSRAVGGLRLPTVLVVILLVFALLESVLGFCAGCWVFAQAMKVGRAYLAGLNPGDFTISGTRPAVLSVSRSTSAAPRRSTLNCRRACRKRCACYARNGAWAPCWASALLMCMRRSRISSIWNT